MNGDDGRGRRNSICMSDFPSRYNPPYPPYAPAAYPQQQYPAPPYLQQPGYPSPYYQQPYNEPPPPRNKMDLNYILNRTQPPYQKIGDFGIYQRPPKPKAKKEKIYGCHLCHMKFSTRNSRKKHILSVHEKQRPYACPYPECSSTFAERGNMVKHVKAVHKKQKNAQCNICGARFAFNDGLLRHKRMTHDNQRPYVCIKCNFGFKQKSHLRVHAMRCQSKGAVMGREGHKSASSSASSLARFVARHF